MEARHRQFADLYLCDPSRNAAQAYMQTYPDASQQTAWQNGSKLLKHATVSAYIAEREAELSKAAGLEQAYVLRGLKKIADTCSADMHIKGNHKLRLTPYTRLVDADAANRSFELLGRTQRMFVDRVESEVVHRFQFTVKK